MQVPKQNINQGGESLRLTPIACLARSRWPDPNSLETLVLISYSIFLAIQKLYNVCRFRRYTTMQTKGEHS